MTDPIDIVSSFCGLMEHRDAAALKHYLGEDAVYQNVGMPATVGADAIVANLGQQFAVFPDSYAYEMINIAASGDTVLTERLDMIKTPAGELVGIPVMGTFVVHAGKIARWTDYWDTSLPMKMMTGEDVAGLLPSDYLSV
ncbi:limonene-1,2-epoxide hydrolase family protein [Mycolicibacterium sp.]|uniref:limonene-1,2-epoxide hydrolase family protein n=1 Tax=Mycolicibacterium sp. TaxID=2320850 RepID=UPI001A24E94F|nr:limonene-1,2-epoxide hydrolase family protein [Mycolicibacterium sp.]MBJ7337139.1 nuclear transport factor 2 family protein [Mycolicibacterium sp.]